MNHIASRFPERIEFHRVDLDEDGYPDSPEVETLTCECGVELPIHLMQVVDDGTDTPLFLCTPCAEDFRAQEDARAEEEDADCPCDIPGRTWCPEHGAILRARNSEVGAGRALAQAAEDFAKFLQHRAEVGIEDVPATGALLGKADAVSSVTQIHQDLGRTPWAADFQAVQFAHRDQELFIHSALNSAGAGVAAPALAPTSVTSSDYNTQNHSAEVA